MHIMLLERDIKRDIAKIEEMGSYGYTEEAEEKNKQKLCHELHLWKLLKEFKKATEIEETIRETITNPETRESVTVERKVMIPPPATS